MIPTEVLEYSHDYFFINHCSGSIIMLFGKFISGVLDPKQFIRNGVHGTPITTTVAEGIRYLATVCLRIDRRLPLAGWRQHRQWPFNLRLFRQHLLDKSNQLVFGV